MKHLCVIHPVLARVHQDDAARHVTEVLLNKGTGGVAVVYLNTYSPLYEANRDDFHAVARRTVERNGSP